MDYNPKCAASHLGPWIVEPNWFRGAVEAIKSGTWAIRSPKAGSDTGPGFAVDPSGVGVLGIEGPIMKGVSKFGGTSSVLARAQIRAAVLDKKVKALLLYIDSPGGTVAGTEALAEEIRRAKAVKPVYAHIDDQGASAAYWIASQADHITANPTALVGSIGVYAVITDSSQAAAMQGIKVHVISTGPLKGAGVPGTEITPDQIAEVQETVDGMNNIFIKQVAAGRKVPSQKIEELADGRQHMAAEAVALGLVDDVQRFSDRLAEIAESVNSKSRNNELRQRIRQARLK